MFSRGIARRFVNVTGYRFADQFNVSDQIGQLSGDHLARLKPPFQFLVALPTAPTRLEMRHVTVTDECLEVTGNEVTKFRFGPSLSYQFSVAPHTTRGPLELRTPAEPCMVPTAAETIRRNLECLYESPSLCRSLLACCRRRNAGGKPGTW